MTLMYIKICGITSIEDALAAIDAGADLLGFNFYPRSPRYITREQCAQITVGLKRGGVRLVGVFVDAAAREVESTLVACGLDLAQLHGDEPADVLAALHGKAFKAFRQLPDASLYEYTKFSSAEPALLLDANVAGTYGGTGVTADWSAARALAAHHPLLLAGGLRAENVAEAVRQVRPWGVDSASGVESAPGRKDPEKMKAFVTAARSANIT